MTLATNSEILSVTTMSHITLWNEFTTAFISCIVFVLSSLMKNVSKLKWKTLRWMGIGQTQTLPKNTSED